MLHSSEAEFQAHFYLIDDTITDLQVWTGEMEPMVWDKRPISEWVREHLLNDVGHIRDLCDLPAEGNFQVLVKKGRIWGGMSGWEIEEWDEDVYLDDLVYAAVPPEYLDRFKYVTLGDSSLLTAAENEHYQRCPACGCNRFRATQACHGEVPVIVLLGNGTPQFLTNDTLHGQVSTDSLEWDNPKGPFTCLQCHQEFQP